MNNETALGAYPRASLVARSLTVATLLMFLVLGSASYLIIALQRKNSHEGLLHYAQITAQSTASALGLTLWNFDKQQAQQQLQALKDSANFCGARILDPQGKIITDIGIPPLLNDEQFIQRQ